MKKISKIKSLHINEGMLSNVIAFDLLSYIAINLFCGAGKKIKASAWVIVLLFGAMMVFTH